MTTNIHQLLPVSPGDSLQTPLLQLTPYWEAGGYESPPFADILAAQLREAVPDNPYESNLAAYRETQASESSAYKTVNGESAQEKVKETEPEEEVRDKTDGEIYCFENFQTERILSSADLFQEKGCQSPSGEGCQSPFGETNIENFDSIELFNINDINELAEFSEKAEKRCLSPSGEGCQSPSSLSVEVIDLRTGQGETAMAGKAAGVGVESVLANAVSGSKTGNILGGDKTSDGFAGDGKTGDAKTNGGKASPDKVSEDKTSGSKVAGAKKAGKAGDVQQVSFWGDEAGAPQRINAVQRAENGAGREVSLELRLDGQKSAAITEAVSQAIAKGAGEAGGVGGQASGPQNALENLLARELHHNFNNDIVRHASMILRDEGCGTIKLALKPESLGNVKIRLEMAENKIIGHIVVESEEALRAFEREVHSLEQAFKDSGFQGASFEMSLAADGRGARQDWQGAEASALASAQIAASRYETHEWGEAPVVGLVDLYQQQTIINMLV